MAVPATTMGKDFALAALDARRVKYKDREAVNNTALPAGSPMYFECIACRADIVVPEAYLTKPDLCTECSALRKVGWLE